MKKVTLGLGLAVVLVGCQFSVGTRDPKTARNTKAPPTATPAATGTTATRPPPRVILRPVPKRAAPAPVALADGGATVPPVPPPVPPTGVPAISGPTDFGVGVADATTQWQGSVYFVNADTKTFPDPNTAKASATLFAKELNVPAKDFTAGFPGVDPARTKWFGIRYTGPLVVTAEADYTLRLVADDGAQLFIDDTLIVDNGGIKSTPDGGVKAPDEKIQPVHLVTGAHTIRVDYLQGTDKVALQLWVKGPNGVEKSLGAALP